MNQNESVAAILSNLSVHSESNRILNQLNLKIARHRITAVTGASGSGKTTLLRSFNRLNDCYPGLKTSGRAELFLQGQWVDIYEKGIPLQILRRRVGIVFQSPHLLPTTIGKNISLPLYLVTGLSKRALFDAVEAALKQVGLWEEVCDRLDSPASILSGGQQQRLCLARTLSLQPEILLLDEPTAMLDQRATRQIEALLLELKRETTIVIVSHDLEQVKRLADQQIQSFGNTFNATETPTTSLIG